MWPRVFARGHMGVSAHVGDRIAPLREAGRVDGAHLEDVVASGYQAVHEHRPRVGKEAPRLPGAGSTPSVDRRQAQLVAPGATHSGGLDHEFGPGAVVDADDRGSLGGSAGGAGTGRRKAAGQQHLAIVTAVGLDEIRELLEEVRQYVTFVVLGRSCSSPPWTMAARAARYSSSAVWTAVRSTGGL